MGRGMDWLTHRTVDVEVRDHDEAGRTVTNQSGVEPAQGQTWPRPLSMDGDRIRHGNGFPGWVPKDCDLRFPHDGGRRMAYRPQTPKDVPTMGPEPQPEKLL